MTLTYLVTYLSCFLRGLFIRGLVTKPTPLIPPSYRDSLSPFRGKLDLFLTEPPLSVVNMMTELLYRP